MEMDEGTFTSLYRLYYQDLFRFAYSYLHSQEEAEDAIQEVFFRIYLRPPKEDGNLKSFLFSCVANQARNVLKQQARKNNGDMDAFSSCDPTDSLLEEVGHLPKKYQEAILLHYYGGLSLEEMAKALKISKENAKKRLERGRAMLKERLKGEAR